MLYGRLFLITLFVLLGSPGLFALEWFQDKDHYEIVKSDQLQRQPRDHEGWKWGLGGKLAVQTSSEPMQASTSSDAAAMNLLTLKPGVDRVVRVTVTVPMDYIIHDKPSPTVYITYDQYPRNLAPQLWRPEEGSDGSNQYWTNYYANKRYDLAKVPPFDFEVRCSRCPTASILEYAILQRKPQESMD